MSLTLPYSFGRYRLTRLVGEGGMAEVYQAVVQVAHGLEKKVVVKKIRRELVDQHEFTRMFVDEAKIALSLNHANIVQVFDFGQVRGDFYLAMEMVEGVDLMRLLHAIREAKHPVPPVITAYIGHQVAAGLAYAHRKTDDYGRALGIVHRDVSPHNVMVSFEGQVKILDFGIARTRARTLEQLEAAARSSVEETIKGKIAYMSPEQARGRPLDQRSDVYSLGICLYELLTGTLLFRQRDRLKALHQVRTTPVPSLREVAPQIPDTLATILDRALEREPSHRYESARALQADLATFLHHSDPVVDDEVLSSFMGHYFRPDPPTGSIPHGLEPGSRDPVDVSHTEYPVRTSRESQRVVVVWVAIDAPEPASGDPPKADAFLNLARDVAFKREGLVLRADTQAVALAFGALLRTGGDAERALRAALALRDDASEAAPGLRLGFLVANAPTVVQRDGQGSVRVELRRGVTAQIDATARAGLEGPVMVSGNLVDLLAEAWRFGESSFVDPPEGTGSAPVVDHEIEHVAPLLGRETRSQRRPLGPPGLRAILVGRELELKTLRDTFSEAIRARHSRAVLVVGDSGMGKRALVERFVASLPRTACWVLRATGSWSRRNTPMGVFLDLLSRFLEIEHHTPTAQIIERLSSLGIREADLLGQTLATAEGLADAAASELPARTRRDRLWRLVRRLIIGLAQRRPVLVIIENLHFHDEQSLDVLREWIQAEQPWPVLGVATGRPGNRRVELIRRESNIAEIHLHELDEQARRELVTRRFEDPEAARPLTEAIVARTGGNPLFIEQTLASLIERGVVAWNTQGRQLVIKQPGAYVALPRTIEAALGERLEELSPADREVLQGAAVLGRHFRAPELPPLLAREVDEPLAQLEDKGFIERIEGARTGTESHRFTTVSLHETCKASLAPTQARRLHGRAAELRQARPDYAEERDAGPVAEHLMAAGRSSEAVDPALCAADYASEVAGNVEAYYYFSLALRGLAPDEPRRFEALLRRERILRAWGRRRAQVADIRQLLDTAERRADPVQLAIATLRLLRFYLEVGRPQAAERLLPRVELRIEAVPDPAVFMAVLAELRSELAFVRGRFDQAEQHALAGLTHCGTDTRGLRQRARLLRSLGQVKSGIGRFDEAREALEEALSLARRIDNVRLEANLLNALGEVAGRSTHYQEAIDYFRASLAIDRELGDRFTTGRKLANLGIGYATVGLWRRAERYLRKALEMHEAVGHPGEWGDVVVVLGEVVASLGDLDAAQALLHDAAEMARRREDVRTELRARIRLARVLLDRGHDDDRPAARTIAQQVLETARNRGLRTARRRALNVLARLEEEAGCLSTAIELEREAVMLARAGADPIDGVRSIHHLGRLLVAHGNPDEGRPLLREAGATLQARLDDLRDEELRRGYLDLPDARRILVDGTRGEASAVPETEPARSGAAPAD